ncbi:MAG: GNAT family N-acetyltransferase [Pseudomonadota bacterium]|nr:GNAT family N-acetyltransferase [Pseudomonadota bacterium]
MDDPAFPLWSGGIGIRPFREDDAAEFVEAVRESIPDLAPFMPWAHPDYSLDEAQSWIEDTRGSFDACTKHEFAIVDTDDHLLGGVGLNMRNDLHRTANLGYWVRSSASDRGVATTAARSAAIFGFKSLRLQRLEILVVPSNSASLRVADKLGALREGVLRNRLRIYDEPLDAVMHSLVPEDMGMITARLRE